MDLARIRRVVPIDFPKIVCLCGSTRFWREFQQASLRETLAGNIVLSIGAASGTDDEHFGNLDRDAYNAVKIGLDQLHLRKIDLADEILVLNVGGYIGDSTRREIEHAEITGKPIRWIEPPSAPKRTGCRDCGGWIAEDNVWGVCKSCGAQKLHSLLAPWAETS